MSSVAGDTHGEHVGQSPQTMESPPQSLLPATSLQRIKSSTGSPFGAPCAPDDAQHHNTRTDSADTQTAFGPACSDDSHWDRMRSFFVPCSNEAPDNDKVTETFEWAHSKAAALGTSASSWLRDKSEDFGQAFRRFSSTPDGPDCEHHVEFERSPLPLGSEGALADAQQGDATDPPEDDSGATEEEPQQEKVIDRFIRTSAETLQPLVTCGPRRHRMA